MRTIEVNGAATQRQSVGDDEVHRYDGEIGLKSALVLEIPTELPGVDMGFQPRGDAPRYTSACSRVAVTRRTMYSATA